MIQPKPVILVNLQVDDSSNSAVILHTQWLAEHMTASVHVFHSVYKPAFKKEPYTLDAKHKKSEAHILSEAKKRLGQCAEVLNACGLDVATSINWNRPTEIAFKQLIDKLEPKLIVTQRPAASLLDRMLPPDKDWNFLKLSEVPVVYVNNPPIKTESPTVWAAVDPMHDHPEHEKLNDLIVDRAKFLATATKAELHLFHCFSSASMLAEIAVGLSSSEYLPVQEVQQETRDLHFEALVTLADRHGIPHTRIHNLPGIAQIVLPVLAARKHPHFVVVGANNKGAVTRLIHGSTTNKLLHRVSGALCIVRLPELVHADERCEAVT